jgi:predicted RNA binding protein YcfA (HicA-like mRNA interferase family)
MEKGNSMTGKRYFKVLLALGFVVFAQSCAGTSSKAKAKAKR